MIYCTVYNIHWLLTILHGFDKCGHVEGIINWLPPTSTKLNMIFYADTGIYVLMFKNIFIRFLKLTILTVLLLLMFALTFYMAFRQFGFLFAKSPFANPGHSILKTISMSIGELGYDELFRQPTGGSTDNVPGIPFPEISYILWIIFIILMPILFGNLLVNHA